MDGLTTVVKCVVEQQLLSIGPVSYVNDKLLQHSPQI